MCLLLLLLTVRLCSDREPNPLFYPLPAHWQSGWFDQWPCSIILYHTTQYYAILPHMESVTPIFLHFVTADKFSNLIFHPKNVFLWEFNNIVIRCIKVLCNILCSIWYSVPARLVTRRMLHESCLLLHHIKHTHTWRRKQAHKHTQTFLGQTSE